MSVVLQKIAIADVSVGMFIEDVFNKDGVLMQSAHTLIESQDQVDRLAEKGVREVYIDVSKCAEVIATQLGESDSSSKNRERTESFNKEFNKAKEIRTGALEAAKSIFKAVRLGASIDTPVIEKTAEDIVGSILRNPDALVSLSQIKGYDEYTYVHSVNVCVLVASLAHSMEYSKESLIHAGIGALLHDVGKMRVPEAILNKPGKYTDEEFAIMKRHPELGLEILTEKNSIPDISKTIVIQHHERYNGNGYPHGLKGDQIADLGFISAVADVYDALTSDRVYRAAWVPQRALALIFQGCDKDYSRGIVEHFTKLLGIYPVGSFVRLKSGQMGIVTRVNPQNLLAPQILVLFDSHGTRCDGEAEMDLATCQSGDDGDQYRIDVSLDPAKYKIDVGEFVKAFSPGAS